MELEKEKSNYNYAVFIASHISYDKQLELLQRAIKSVKNQDYKEGSIDIWLSISFENSKYADDFDNLKIAEECFKCLKQKKKSYQLEHLQKINEASYMDYNYDLVMFLDDDDEYMPNRITAFHNKLIEIEKDDDVSIKTQVLLENALCNVNGGEVVECLIYWCYAIKQDAFNLFFKLFTDKSYQSNNADFLLKMYMEHLSLLNENVGIGNGFYIYNTENDNSISSKNDKRATTYYFTCLNEKVKLIEIYGINYKKYINKILWKECFKNFHRFSCIENWSAYIFGEMNKHSIIKYIKK